MTAFRIYFIDGEALRVCANTPEIARKTAQDRRPGLLITKIKRMKDGSTIDEMEQDLAQAVADSLAEDPANG